MLNAPARPLAEGVVGPVPAIFLKEGDAVAQIVPRAFGPSNCAELANVDFRAILHLELPNRGNNNIKRIMGIVERMSNFYGKGGFPTVKSLVDAKEDDLMMLGLGFRAPYIVNTARAVYDGLINLDELKKMDIDAARGVLMKVKGIGPKVADCALLFGCHRLDCFPMDVWMKRVMATCFSGQDKSIFGPCAGVAQQYLFHFARTSGYFDDKEK